MSPTITTRNVTAHSVYNYQCLGVFTKFGKIWSLAGTSMLLLAAQMFSRGSCESPSLRKAVTMNFVSSINNRTIKEEILDVI